MLSCLLFVRLLHLMHIWWSRKMKKLQRREFLKLSAAVGAYGLLGVENIYADNDSSGYKAIVVLYQAGGNDSLNMFVPSSADTLTGYSNYAAIRDNIKVENNNLPLSVYDNGDLDLSGGNPYADGGDLSKSYTKGFYRHTDSSGKDLGYATNATMPELAHLVNKGKVAIVANCGNLIKPVTKAELSADKTLRPPFLFAHNHQTKLALNGVASELNFTGWAGRVADHWSNVNGGSVYGVNIAIRHKSHLFYGEHSSALFIPANGPTTYYNIDSDLNKYTEFMNANRRDIFRNFYNKIRQHSFVYQNTLKEDWDNKAPSFSSKNAYGGNLFSYPSSSTLDQHNGQKTSDEMLGSMEAVAKWIKIGKDNGLKRQIFYVKDGGYDTHHNQVSQHPRRLRGVSMALGDFYKALEEMGMENEVTLMSVSEFGRSTGNNGSGSDHAWGGSYFMLGGAVKGGLYGTLPDLTLGSDDDLTHKGRLIPTTSFTQYYATALKWFGLDNTTLHTILPELSNFSGNEDLGYL